MRLATAVRALPAVLYLAGIFAVIIALSSQSKSLRVHILNEDGKHPVSMLQTSKLVMQAKGVSSGALDAGLPTMTDSSIWEAGSPENSGWSQGDYHTGTGRIKDTQYSWWQRHLMPSKDFNQVMNGLQSSEPHYDQHGNEEDPSGLANPQSYRNPGFSRMTP